MAHVNDIAKPSNAYDPIISLQLVSDFDRISWAAQKINQAINTGYISIDMKDLLWNSLRYLFIIKVIVFL